MNSIRSVIHFVRYLIAVIRYLRDPNQVQSVLNLGNRFVDAKSYSLALSRISANPLLEKMVQENYGIADFPMEYLQTLPVDTLGGAYCKFLQENSLQPHFYKNHLMSSKYPELDYLAFRARQTHDLWHVVLEFSISQEDEAGLMAFYFAQNRSQLSGLLVGLSFVHFLLKRRQDMALLVSAVARGWRLGLIVKPLTVVKWEEIWHRPLCDVRAELNYFS